LDSKFASPELQPKKPSRGRGFSSAASNQTIQPLYPTTASDAYGVAIILHMAFGKVQLIDRKLNDFMKNLLGNRSSMSVLFKKFPKKIFRKI
jgi:hypothetical protein